jgi:hypothetical protein
MTVEEVEGRLNESLKVGKTLRLKKKQIEQLEGFRAELGGRINESRLNELWKGYARDVARALFEKSEASRLVSLAGRKDERLVLEARYVLCLKWEEIADLAYYSTVHVYRLARAGMKDIARKAG